MVIDDHDNNDPLQHMQIKALMAEEKRKQEIHGLDVRHREAQMTGPSTSTAVPEAPVDDFGESLLSSLERQQVLSFPTVPKKHVIAIARNTFDPANLPSLDSLIVDDLTFLRRRQDKAIQERWESFGNQVPHGLIKELYHLRFYRLHLSRHQISSNRQKAPRISQHHRRAISDLRLAQSSPLPCSAPA